MQGQCYKQEHNKERGTMTLEQKIMLRKAMRQLRMSVGYMKSYNFSEAMTMLNCGYAELQKLLTDVEINDKDSEDSED